jgi:hypothetical protein
VSTHNDRDVSITAATWTFACATDTGFPARWSRCALVAQAGRMASATSSTTVAQAARDFSCLDHLGGDVAQLAVQVLGRAEQHRERVLLGQAPKAMITPMANRGGVLVERLHVARVQVQRAERVVLEEQPERQHAAHAGLLDGAVAEVRPALVVGEVVGQEHLVFGDGVQARALSDLVLDGVHPGRDLVGGGDGVDGAVSVHEGDRGVVAAVDRLHRRAADPEVTPPCVRVPAVDHVPERVVGTVPVQAGRVAARIRVCTVPRRRSEEAPG